MRKRTKARLGLFAKGAVIGMWIDAVLVALAPHHRAAEPKVACCPVLQYHDQWTNPDPDNGKRAITWETFDPGSTGSGSVCRVCP